MNNTKRINWLEKAYTILRQEMICDAPENITINFGFPSSGARGNVLGECIYDFVKIDTIKNHFITVHFKTFKSAIDVLNVLIHEMIHATGIKGHGKMFASKAGKIGLVGPWKATTLSDPLKEKLAVLIRDKIGQMPSGHGQFCQVEKKKQTTRMRKYQCACDVIIRAATDALRVVCLECGGEFAIEEKEE